QSRAAEVRPASSPDLYGGGRALHLSRRGPRGSQRKRGSPAYGEQAHVLRAGSAAAFCVGEVRPASNDSNRIRRREAHATEAGLLVQVERVFCVDVSVSGSWTKTLP